MTCEVNEMNTELTTIKWAMELSNQEGYKGPQDVELQYKIDLLGC